MDDFGDDLFDEFEKPSSSSISTATRRPSDVDQPDLDEK